MISPALSRWHQLVAARDPSGIERLLADNVVFHSPVAHAPQEGRLLAAWYLSAAFDVFFNDSFRYVREIVGDYDAMLEFETRIDGIVVNGVDIIKWNGSGEITEFKVMLRPLKAINLIHQRMGEVLQSRKAP